MKSIVKVKSLLSKLIKDERGDGMGQLLASVGGVVLVVGILSVMIPSTKTVVLSTISRMLASITTLFR